MPSKNCWERRNNFFCTVTLKYKVLLNQTFKLISMKMKKNDWLLVCAVAAYSYLFYEQQAGINYLIFTLILLGLILIQTKTEIFKKATWQITAAASVLSAINVVLVNSGLAVIANFVSLVLLAGYSKMPETSI